MFARVKNAAGMRAGWLAISLLLPLSSFLLPFVTSSCAEKEPVRISRPGPEERELRRLFIEAHPELAPELQAALRRFQITPEEALRRQEYVSARPDLSRPLRQAILSGDVQLGMTMDHVRAAWGEPARTQALDAGGSAVRWVYPVAGHGGEEQETELVFRDGVLVALRRL